MCVLKSWRKRKGNCVWTFHIKQCLAWGAAPQECCLPTGMVQGKPWFCAAGLPPYCWAIQCWSSFRQQRSSPLLWKALWSEVLDLQCYSASGWGSWTEMDIDGKVCRWQACRWQMTANVSHWWLCFYFKWCSHLVILLARKTTLPNVFIFIKPTRTNTLPSQCLKAALRLQD